MTGTVLMREEQVHRADAGIVKDWLDIYSESTRRVYQPRAEFFFNQVGKSLRELTADDLRQFNAHLRQTITTLNTRRACQTAVRSLLQFAAQSGVVDRDLPYQLEVELSSDPVEPRPLPAISLDRALNREKRIRNQLIVLLSLGLKCTVPEIEHLQWQDINWSTRTIKLFDRKGTSRLIVVRDQDLWDRFRELLNKYYPARQGRSGPIIQSSRDDRTNSSLHVSQIYRVVRRALIEEGLDITLLQQSFKAEQTPCFIIRSVLW